MTINSRSTYFPLNVVVAGGSASEIFFRQLSGEPATSKLDSSQPESVTAGLSAGFKPTPEHDLIFHGGKTIKDLRYTNYYLGGASSWKSGDIKQIDAALAAAMSDVNLNHVMMQYFDNRTITSTFLPSQILGGVKPDTFSQSDVEKLIQQLYDEGRFKEHDLTETVFNFLLPSGSVLTTDVSASFVEPHMRNNQAIKYNPEDENFRVDSLHGLGGYHGSVHTLDKKGTVYYAIGVYSEQRPDGTINGINAFDAAWKNVVATFYHELNEARTDPDVEDAIRAGDDPQAEGLLGWVSRQGEECGDFPVFEAGNSLRLVMQEVPLANGGGVVPIQLQYSNAVHGPEGPIAAPHGQKT